MKQKVCSRCGESLSLEMFYRNAASRDGLQNNCKGCAKEYRRQWNVTKAGKDYSKRHRPSNEVWRAWYTEDYGKNPEKWKNKSHNRRALEVGDLTPGQWQELCLLFNNKCLSCEESKPLTIDHIVPLSKGGRHTLSNVQPLCQSCNSRKGVQSTDFRVKFAP